MGQWEIGEIKYDLPNSVKLLFHANGIQILKIQIHTKSKYFQEKPKTQIQIVRIWWLGFSLDFEFGFRIFHSIYINPDNII